MNCRGCELSEQSRQRYTGPREGDVYFEGLFLLTLRDANSFLFQQVGILHSGVECIKLFSFKTDSGI